MSGFPRGGPVVADIERPTWRTLAPNQAHPRREFDLDPFPILSRVAPSARGGGVWSVARSSSRRGQGVMSSVSRLGPDAARSTRRARHESSSSPLRELSPRLPITPRPRLFIAKRRRFITCFSEPPLCPSALPHPHPVYSPRIPQCVLAESVSHARGPGCVSAA